MERLTIRDKNGEAHMICKQMCGDYGHQCDGQIDVDMCQRYVAFDKLAEYEDLEEQGLLLKLPCKVGDTVWDNDYGKPCPYTVTGFSFGTGEGYIDEPVSLKEVVYYYSNYSGSITGSFAVSELGKSVFLTQAEAEKKLKESEV